MKSNNIKLLALSVIFFMTLMGCSKNKSSLNLNVSAVQTLYDPTDSVAVVLQPSATASTFFDWSPALAADGGMVMYEVVFDLPNGDFSNPIYKLASDNGGITTQATILYKTLNQIATLAGAGPSEAITLKWAVLSTKGVNEVLSQTSRLITITRLAGFSEYPTNLYMDGAGSEAGQQFTSTGSGTFEIYTKLTAGQTFQFVDALNNPANIYFNNASNVLEEGTTGSTVQTTGVYRIDLDFSMGTATYTQINKIALWYGQGDDTAFSVPYAGQGVWQVTSSMNLGQVTWNGDWGYWEDRYKFEYFTTQSDGTASTEWWGSVNSDNNAPTSSTPLSFWYLTPVTSDQWNNSFKFDHSLVVSSTGQMTIDVTITMNASGPYTHSISQ